MYLHSSRISQDKLLIEGHFDNSSQLIVPIPLISSSMPLSLEFQLHHMQPPDNVVRSFILSLQHMSYI